MKSRYVLSLITVALFLSSPLLWSVGPVITSQSGPIAGVTIKTQSVATAGLNPGSAGANVTWDFSGLTSKGGVQSTVFVAASTAPGFSLFPSATLASTSANNPGSYAFYEITSQYMKLLGDVEAGDTNTFDGYFFFKFPASFGSSYRVSYTGSGRTNTTRSEITNVDTSDADAYGTIKLPSGTFNNVLRIHRHGMFSQTSTDTTENFEAFLSQYYFIDPTLSVGPVFQITGFNVPFIGYQVIGADYYVGQTGGSDVGDESAQQEKFRFAPQPANDCLWINSSFVRDQDTHCSILNVVGDVVATFIIQPGAPYNVDTSILPSGMYRLILDYAHSRQMSSFVVVH